MSNLKIEETDEKINFEQIEEKFEKKEKTRQELFAEQLRLREESKRRQKENAEQAKALEVVKSEERNILFKEQQKQLQLVMTIKAKPDPAQETISLKAESDDDIIIDEEMTNKNVCIGMVNTDIVVEKSPLILIRDEQFEIVSLESEGKLSDNYCK